MRGDRLPALGRPRAFVGRHGEGLAGRPESDALAREGALVFAWVSGSPTPRRPKGGGHVDLDEAEPESPEYTSHQAAEPSSTRPSEIATAISARESAPRRTRIWLTWNSTVLMLMYSVRAISRFVNPSATASATDS